MPARRVWACNRQCPVGDAGGVPRGHADVRGGGARRRPWSRSSRSSSAPRREPGRAFRWTLPEQWHLTLAFAEQRPRPGVRRAGGPARRRCRASAGPIAGPDRGRRGVSPRRQGEGPLRGHRDRRRGAATGSATGCPERGRAPSGVEVDGQRFRPHLTLARMSRPVEATNWVRLLDTYSRSAVAGRGDRARRVPPRRGAPPAPAATRWSRPFRIGRAGSGPAPPDAPPRGR